AGSQTATRPGQTASPAQNNPATGPRPTTPATPATPTTGAPGTPGSGPTGGINGVASKSKATSIRLYKGRNHYNEWAFVYTQQTQTPGAGPPGVVGPGEPARGGPNPSTSPFGTPGRGVQPPGGRGSGPGSSPPIFPP